MLKQPKQDFICSLTSPSTPTKRIIPPERRMSRCWTCKRRRLKCDGGTPHCQKCLGHGTVCVYQKPLTWVKGVARRGPTKDRTFGDSQQHPLPEEPRNQVTALSASPRRSPAGETYITGLTLPGTLTNPLFQGLSSSSRFFIDYFSQRVCPSLVFEDRQDNYYRGMIVHISSPVVASAIVTVSTCHYIQSLTGVPLAGIPGLMLSTQNQAIWHDPSFSNTASAGLSKEAIFVDYLRSKSRCLKLISSALARGCPVPGDKATLIAVVLLTILDMFESGSGAWTYHLEGAKKLLDAGYMDGAPAWDLGAKSLLQGAAIFQTFGSSLAKPGALTSASTLHSAWTTTSSAITPVGCPSEILAGIEVFASHRRLNTLLPTSISDIESLLDTLHLLRTYDIPTWAAYVTISDSAVPYEDLVHLGSIWKFSAVIYACSVVANSAESSSFDLGAPHVHDIIAEYSFLERENDEVVKCLIWPTFVAGAACTSYAERTWALKTLERIWQVGRCANTRNAIQILKTLWDRYDMMDSRNPKCFNISDGTGSIAEEKRSWNWVKELSKLRGSWLFF